MRGVITEIVHRVKAGMSLSGLLVGVASTLNAATECEGTFRSGEPLSPVVVSNVVSETLTSPVVTMGKILPVPNENRRTPDEKRYRVLRGDTLLKIAVKYKTTVAELKRLNRFDDTRANRLKVGEVILVPLADTHVKKHQRDE